MAFVQNDTIDGWGLGYNISEHGWSRHLYQMVNVTISSDEMCSAQCLFYSDCQYSLFNGSTCFFGNFELNATITTPLASFNASVFYSNVRVCSMDSDPKVLLFQTASTLPSISHAEKVTQ